MIRKEAIDTNIVNYSKILCSIIDIPLYTNIFLFFFDSRKSFMDGGS